MCHGICLAGWGHTSGGAIGLPYRCIWPKEIAQPRLPIAQSAPPGHEPEPTRHCPRFAGLLLLRRHTRSPSPPLGYDAAGDRSCRLKASPKADAPTPPTSLCQSACQLALDASRHHGPILNSPPLALSIAICILPACPLL